VKDFIFLGPVPANENCAQLGTENYKQIAKFECELFKSQLEEHYKNDLSSDLRFKILPQDHDFGTYYEVVLEYYANFEDKAFQLESEIFSNNCRWTKENMEKLENFKSTLSFTW